MCHTPSNGCTFGVLSFRCLNCRYKSKKKAFCHYSKKYADGSKSIQADLEQLRKQATVIRLLVHTQIGKIGFGQKKAHLAEIQVPACMFTLDACGRSILALSSL